MIEEYLSRFLKFVQIKEGDLISWGEGTNSADQLNYLLRLLYLNFDSFKDPNSFLFLRFQCILHGYVVLSKTFHISTNYTEGTRFLGRTNSAASLNYLILLSFMFKSFKDPNSSSFIRFKCILYHSGEVFSEFWNFYKLKGGWGT